MVRSPPTWRLGTIPLLIGRGGGSLGAGAAVVPKVVFGWSGAILVLPRFLSQPFSMIVVTTLGVGTIKIKIISKRGDIYRQ